MRMFIAVTVGDELRERVTAVRRTIETELTRSATEAPRIVWVKPAALHVTLAFLGEVPDERAEAVTQALAAPYERPAFPVVWRGLGAFPSPRHPRTLWVGVSEGAPALGAIERAVASRLGRLLPREHDVPAPPFHPHVTIARVKTEGHGVAWPSILAAADVTGPSQLVTHVSVCRSRGLPGGEGYEEIGRGPLVG